MDGSPTPLSEEGLTKLIATEGAIHHSLPTFEARRQQQEMLRAVTRAYNEDGLALIEAGTGTGKSMAYLLPALYWALQNKETTLIATNTIALQEQLLHKDIPLLTKILKIDCKAVLVKGMSNYLCLRRLQETLQELPLTGESAAEIQKIADWGEKTNDGSRSNLPFTPTPATWERVCADNTACEREKCPHSKQCHFLHARRQAGEAQLIIANHHLLFADIAQRAENDNYKSAAVLPSYNHLIIDEAHHLEDIASTYLGQQTNYLAVIHLLNQLSSDTTGKLQQLASCLMRLYKKKSPLEVQTLLQRLQIDLIAEKMRIADRFFELFASIQAFAISYRARQQEEGPLAIRMLPEYLETCQWKESVVPRALQLKADVASYLEALYAILKNIEAMDDEKFKEATKGPCLDIKAIANKLERALTNTIQFTLTPLVPDVIRWIQLQQLKDSVNTQIFETPLEVAPLLAEQVFKRFHSIVLCSATLTTNRSFEFCRARLGLTDALLPDRDVKEYLFDSPFDFSKQSLLVIPNNMPLPSSPQFIEKACLAIESAVAASYGNAFILFTSYASLMACYQLLEKTLRDKRYHLFKQGDSSRHTLLGRFKETNNSILFGTSSFWEGVDVVGEALRCVIIVKLPFKVPTEPILEARSAAITAKGGDPFLELSLPHAIVKFKQGFGRLIRHKRDRGCIVCLDVRIAKKKYGAQILNSLPNCQIATPPLEGIKDSMQQFYRETHHLTI